MRYVPKSSLTSPLELSVHEVPKDLLQPVFLNLDFERTSDRRGIHVLLRRHRDKVRP